MLTAPGYFYRFDAGSRFRWLAFQDEGHGGWGLPKQLPHGADDSVHRCVRSWCERWWRDGAHYLTCCAELTVWLIDLCAAPPKAAAPSERDPWLTQVQAVVEQQIEHGVTAATLHQAMGLSRAQLFRRLAEHGYTVKSLVDATREQVALGYLKDGRVRVSGVARMCGFASSTVFSRWFKERMGLTPTAWRTRNLSGFTPTRLGRIPRAQLGQWSHRRRYP
jgi:AraC-like DNA-binding protein